MEVVYTRHAKNRMRWRGIKKHEVEMTLKEPERREIIGPNRFHYFRHFGKRYVRVTCATEDEKLIVISAVDKSE